jgi:divalent metal cation (Fe/Co/Zn/Cd) transporter
VDGQRLIAGSYGVPVAYASFDAVSALLGWWWADPVAALGIAAIAAWEGVEAWRGDLCDSC